MIECLNRLGRDVEIVVNTGGRRAVGHTQVVVAEGWRWVDRSSYLSSGTVIASPGAQAICTGAHHGTAYFSTSTARRFYADADSPGAVPLDIWITGDRITALIEPGAPVPEPWRSPAIETIDARHCLAIPGLIDAHCHSYAAMLHGTVPGAPLDLFVLDAMARRAPRSERFHYVSAQVHALELLKRGITAHVDHFRNGALPTKAAVDATFSAYRDIGIRATVAPMYEDKSYIDSMPIDRGALPPAVQARWGAMTKPPPQSYFELMDSLLGWRGKDGRLDLLLGVDGPQRCTRALMELTGDYAEKHAIGLHTHLLEAKTQHMVAPKETGGSFIAYLDQFGVVNPRSSFVHFVWCTARDMELAGERGVNIVHNPLSNLHLGSGLQPTARLLELGVPLALGTDSASCAAASMLEAAKLMCLISRVLGNPEAQWIRERAAFRAATAGGARVLGLEKELGAIAPGYRADLALIDTRGIEWRPRGDVYAHLVMSESGANVRDVIVAGKVVVRERRVVNVDEAALLAEAEELIRSDTAANAEWLAVVAEERPAFSALLENALQKPASVERHARLC